MNVNSYQRQLLQEWAGSYTFSTIQWSKHRKIVQISPPSAPQSVNCCTSGTTPIPHTTHSFGSLKIRYGIDSLAAIIERKYKMQLFVTNMLFFFCGHSSSKIKGLLWEGDGFNLSSRCCAQL